MTVPWVSHHLIHTGCSRGVLALFSQPRRLNITRCSHAVKLDLHVFFLFLRCTLPMLLVGTVSPGKRWSKTPIASKTSCWTTCGILPVDSLVHWIRFVAGSRGPGTLCLSTGQHQVHVVVMLAIWCSPPDRPVSYTGPQGFRPICRQQRLGTCTLFKDIFNSSLINIFLDKNAVLRMSSF